MASLVCTYTYIRDVCSSRPIHRHYCIHCQQSPDTHVLSHLWCKPSLDQFSVQPWYWTSFQQTLWGLRVPRTGLGRTLIERTAACRAQEATNMASPHYTTSLSVTSLMWLLCSFHACQDSDHTSWPKSWWWGEHCHQRCLRCRERLADPFYGCPGQNCRSPQGYKMYIYIYICKYWRRLRRVIAAPLWIRTHCWKLSCM